MSAQTRTLAALLAATVIMTPAALEAKPDKERGAQSAGQEQRRGNGGGEDTARDGAKTHGKGNREARRATDAVDRAARAPRQAFEGRGRDSGKRARQERPIRVERVAAEVRQQREAARPKRWDGEREAQRITRGGKEARPDRVQRERATYVVENRRSGEDKLGRQIEKQVARQQQATYRAEVKQQREWSRQQRQAIKQAAAFGPVMVYQQPAGGYARDVRYVYAPAYRTPAIATVSAFPAYAGYDYPPRYARDESYGYTGWSEQQAASGWPPYASHARYAPYTAGYGGSGLFGDGGGLGGLFGGGGGFGDILVALLPLLLGDSLGLTGLTGGAIDGGMLGSAAPGLAGGYGATDYAAVGYADPGYGYQDASLGQGLPGPDQGLFGGGDGLMALLPLVLDSGLLGGGLGGLGSGGLGGLSGVDGGFGFANALGIASPEMEYAAPYAADTGLLSGLGLV